LVKPQPDKKEQLITDFEEFMGRISKDESLMDYKNTLELADTILVTLIESRVLNQQWDPKWAKKLKNILSQLGNTSFLIGASYRTRHRTREIVKEEEIPITITNLIITLDNLSTHIQESNKFNRMQSLYLPSIIDATKIRLKETIEIIGLDEKTIEKIEKEAAELKEKKAGEFREKRPRDTKETYEQFLAKQKMEDSFCYRCPLLETPIKGFCPLLGTLKTSWTPEEFEDKAHRAYIAPLYFCFIYINEFKGNVDTWISYLETDAPLLRKDEELWFARRIKETSLENPQISAAFRKFVRDREEEGYKFRD